MAFQSTYPSLGTCQHFPICRFYIYFFTVRNYYVCDWLLKILPATIHMRRSCVQQTRHDVVTETHSSIVQNTSQVIVTHHWRQHEELLVKVTSRCAVAGLSIIGKARSAYITSSPLVTAKRFTVFNNNFPTRCDLFSLLDFCRQFYMF